MSFGLLATTVLTGAADSLNPVLITQQFVLQGMVKKPGHIWYFIGATAFTSFAVSLLACYGLLAVVTNYLDDVVRFFGKYLYIAEFLLAVFLFMAAVYFLLDYKIRFVLNELNELKRKEEEEEAQETREAKSKVKSVKPGYLIALGTVSTLSEIATALPLFAFLAVVVNCGLHLTEVFFLLAVYNLIYCAPLVILYIIYRRKQALFDKTYTFIKHKVKKWTKIIVPGLFLAAGVLLTFHSMTLMMHLIT